MNLTTKRIADFIDASPSPFHAVDTIETMLLAQGAQKLEERQEWQLEPGATYCVNRQGTTIVAFRVGLKAAAESGFVSRRSTYR